MATVLLGGSAGEHAVWPQGAGRLPADPASWWRLAAAMPALQALPGGPACRWAGWGATAVTAFIAGNRQAAQRDGRVAAAAPSPLAPSAWQGANGRAVLRVTAWPRTADDGSWRAPAVVMTWSAAPGGDDGPAGRPRVGEGLQLHGRGEPPDLWQVVAARVRAEVPRPAMTFGGYDEARYFASRGLAWRARARPDSACALLPPADLAARAGTTLGTWYDNLQAVLDHGLPPRENGLARGILLGSGADPALRDPFQRLGLAHVFSVSGLHVGLIAGLAVALLGIVVRSSLGRWAALAPLLAVYAILVSLPGSVLRAAGMALLVLGAPLAGRRVDGLRLLGLLFWANVVWQPAAVFDTGLRLSYLAAAGLVLGSRLMGARLAALPRWARAVASGGTATLAAQTATMIEVGVAFGRLNLMSPLANLVGVPLFSLAVTLGALGVVIGLFWGWAADGLLAVTTVFLRLLGAGGNAAAAGASFAEVGLPGFGPARVVIYLGLAAAIAIALARPGGGKRWRHALVIAALGLALTITATWDSERDRGGVLAAQCDVGQGDCAYVRMPDGWTVLIDAGEAWGANAAVTRDVVPWLRRHGTRRLDAVLLTHNHDDHTGGAAPLAAQMRVDRWYLGGGAAAPAASTAPATRPVAGDTLHAAGPWALVCVHPPAGQPAEPNENNSSTAVALLHGTRLVALWSGDLETAGEARLVAALPSGDGSAADYWKAGHHGSRTSGSSSLLERVRPRLIGVSCAVGNRHHHPSHGPYVVGADTLACVRTDLDGMLLLRWRADGRGTWRTARGRAGALDTSAGRP